MRKIIAPALALFLAGCSQLHSPSVPPIEYKNVGDMIQKVKGGKVKYFPVNGAKRQLIHIRQVHLHTESKAVSNEKIARIHSEIYSIISSLCPEGQKYPLYVEGYSEETVNKFNQFIERLRDLTNYSNKLAFSGNPDSSTQRMILLREINSAWEDVMQYDASFPLALEKRVSIKSTETEELNTAYKKAKNLDEQMYLVTEPREEYFLSHIDPSIKRVVVIYGGAHAFGGRESCGKDYSLEGRISFIDNLAKYNKEHPNSKMELIEIVPSDYP